MDGQVTPDTTRLEELLKGTGVIGGVFTDMGIAEDEFKKALKRHGGGVQRALDMVWVLLIRPPHLKGQREIVYRAHIAELLDRAATQGVTKKSINPGTVAEVMIVMSETSLLAPLNKEGAALYFYCFKQIFGATEYKGDQKIQALIKEMEDSRQYAPQYEGQLEEALNDARRKMSQERL